jgi:nucleotide-binding universal stress UspA family protein
VQAIRGQDILQDFPGRTETDLFLWISQHRVAIRDELGMDFKPETRVAELAARFSPRPERVAARLMRHVLNVVMADKLDAGPPPGQWRKEHLVTHRAGRLFDDVLVAVSGVGYSGVDTERNGVDTERNADEAGWHALDQAIEIARREQARVVGFHAPDSDAPADLEKARAVEAEFNRRCEDAGLEGKLVFQVGQVARHIAERSWWVDLIVLSRSYATASQPQTHLASGLRTILRTCARPVLTVPGPASPLARALLAYDGSPRAEEALFVATYLAERWAMPLVVLTVETGRVKPGTHKRAQDYMAEHQAPATFVQQRGPVVPEILIVAEEHACDWIITGSYGPNLFEAARDSTVDDLLRTSTKPVLICR